MDHNPVAGALRDAGLQAVDPKHTVTSTSSGLPSGHVATSALKLSFGRSECSFRIAQVPLYETPQFCFLVGVALPDCFADLGLAWSQIR
jgi:hypothetical protein